MTTEACAIAIERAFAVSQGASFIDQVERFFLGERETAAELAARCNRLIIGAAEPLRQAKNEAEFRATFDLLDGRAFLSEFGALLASPAFPEALRQARLFELTRRRPEPRNQRALELRDDLLERLTLLFSDLASEPASAPQSLSGREMTAAVQGLMAAAPDCAAEVGRFLACTITLTYAAFGRAPWEPWQLGLVWTFGERSLKTQAKQFGLPAEQAAARMTTKRDRELMRQPADLAASDEALALLDLDS